MVIAYHGNVRSVKDDLVSVEDKLNQRYIEVLGEGQAKKVGETAKRVLDKQSFLNSREECLRYFEQLREDAPASFGVATNSPLEVKANGHINEKKVATAPVFYMSDEAFKHSGYSKITDRPLATYVHEFNHFVFYALQNPPVFLVNLFFGNYLKTRESRFQDIEEYTRQLEKEDIGMDEKIKKLIIGAHASLIVDAYESSTRILDKLILDSIGIDVPLDWRHKERGCLATRLPTGQIIGIGHGGDMFKDLEDKEVVRRFVDWNQYLNQRVSAVKYGMLASSTEETQYITNVINSVKDLRVSRMPIQDLERLRSKREKKSAPKQSAPMYKASRKFGKRRRKKK